MRTRTSLFVVAAVLAATSAFAQPQSTWSASLGWFPTSFSTSARLFSNTNSNNSSVDLENDLGLQTHLSNVRLEGMWRFKPRHRIEMSYTSWRRSGDKTINFPIDWQDTHYDAGANLKTINNSQFIKLAYD